MKTVVVFISLLACSLAIGAGNYKCNANITVDGFMNDWAGIYNCTTYGANCWQQSYNSPTLGVAGTDVKGLWVALDTNYFYFAITVDNNHTNSLDGETEGIYVCVDFHWIPSVAATRDPVNETVGSTCRRSLSVNMEDVDYIATMRTPFTMYYGILLVKKCDGINIYCTSTTSDGNVTGPNDMANPANDSCFACPYQAYEMRVAYSTFNISRFELQTQIESIGFAVHASIGGGQDVIYYSEYTVCKDCALAGTDCNSNGQDDSCDLLDGATDCNGDGILDSCQQTCANINYATP